MIITQHNILRNPKLEELLHQYLAFTTPGGFRSIDRHKLERLKLQKEKENILCPSKSPYFATRTISFYAIHPNSNLMD